MNTNDRPIRYDLIDSRTGAVLKSYKNREVATRAADQKDMAYGAVRYIVKPIWAD